MLILITYETLPRRCDERKGEREAECDRELWRLRLELSYPA